MKHLVIPALALAALLFAGCQVDPTSPTLEGPSSLHTAALSPVDLNPLDLLTTFSASLEADHEVFSGLYTPGTDVILGGLLQSWPGTFAAALRIPAGALPDDHRPVTISLSVPRFRKHLPAGEQPPMVLSFEPDGIQFKEPLEVTVHYPPWLEDTDGSSLFRFYCLEPVYAGNDLVRVDYTDLQWLDRGPDGGPLTFQVPHFSRWELGQEEPDEDGDGGSILDTMSSGSPLTP